MRITDHRYERDNRKHDLAVWMVAFMARTGTLIQWTRLTQYRLQKLFREYLKKDQGTRRRGISPIQPAYFFRSQRLESESLVLAYFAYQLHALPDSVLPNARRSLPGVARGERVMLAFEAYRAVVPDPSISLEYAILLIVELAEGRNVYLRRCGTCKDLMVVERYGGRHVQCPFCRQDHRPDAKRGGAGEPAEVASQRIACGLRGT